MYKRTGYNIVPETNLDEMCTTVDPRNTMRPILRRLRMEVKKTNARYQITHIHHSDHRTKFEINVQLERDAKTFTFILNQDYPFQAPLRMFVNGTAVSHEKYAALERMGALGGCVPQLNQSPNPLLCDEVKWELGKLHRGRKCLFCQLYRSGTWSPAKFLGTLVDEYLEVREEVLEAICKGVGRAKLTQYRVVLPDVLVDKILSWV